jgi:hypothetical protein
MVEQEAATQGIVMSRRVERVLVTRQEIVILPKAEPTITKGVLMVIRVRYNEPRFH